MVPNGQSNCFDILGPFGPFGSIRPKQVAMPSRIVGQGYNQAGTFWSVLNFSLRVYGAQLGLRHTFGLLTGVPADLSGHSLRK